MDKDYNITIENDLLTINYIKGGPWKKESESFSLCEGNMTDEQINAEIAYRVKQNRK